jgi:cytidine deaminase
MMNIVMLLGRARLAATSSYSPYSKFPVGAAVLTKSGKVFTGCNVENASYGLTICAERNAVFQAVAAGETEIERVAIYTPTYNPTAPCGACRQVINEFGPRAEIMSGCLGVDTIHLYMDDLLPHAFGPANL